ncbi:WavE lipopolysaccharide synthesis family protein [Vibrio metschnikovii]|uniref:WavE lipopolysaccharide synthesis family protein n=1 Tax=Vibrio metschnikovii TaxID=28172 RepID=UPI001C2FFD11|nr:WavE lipopolysaccharide synthesis family protein [Vibrio metschnikovii]
MDFSDITVVVQGPVQTFQDRPQEPNITHKCVSSVREHLPGAKIILSTWPNQDLTGLDYDELVISDDPGINIRQFTIQGKPQAYNNNRQIVSSKAGLEHVVTPYAVKLRSDNYLTGNHFVELQQQYRKRSQEYAFFKEHVVVSDVFTRRYAKGFPVAFHISDFFYYGRTEDVLALWDIALFEDFQPTEAVPINNGFPDFVIDCTQALFLAAIQKFDSSLTLNSLLDNNQETLLKSEKVVANNLIVASPRRIGLGLCQKFLGTARVSRRSGKVAHVQFFEWQKWYQRHCDPSMVIENYTMKAIKLFMMRCFYIFPNRPQTKIKILKRKFGNMFR